MIPELPTEQHKRCAALLEIVWHAIPLSYKRHYAREIWRQFQEEVESNAYTSDLGKFANSLCSRFNAYVASNAEATTLAEILETNEDKALLKLLREDTLLLVNAVRVANQERKEELEAERKGE